MARVEKFTEKHPDGEREGLHFHCPGCDGTHSVYIKGTNCPIWNWDGNLDLPTIKPSVLVQYGNKPGSKRCHSYVTAGKIQFVNDSNHKLAGKTVDLPDASD